MSYSYEDFCRHLGDREYFGQKLGLEKIGQVLERLGHPERQFPCVHIAGTNGKGSTAAMIAAILKGAGYRTALYTSPHLIDFCERIRIDSEKIAPDDVLSYARRIHEVEEEPLTFFELATAMAFLHFAARSVDIAVLETGMGGRLDATNVVRPLISVITTIAMDHQLHLGETIEQIAAEKAGIIKEGVPVVAGSLPDSAMRVVTQVAASKSSPIFQITRPVPSSVKAGLAGEHQRLNAAIALHAASLLNKMGFNLREEHILDGLAHVSWPGRLETVRQTPWILLDGAHNLEAMRAVREFLEKNLRGRRLTVLMGAMTDKDLTGLIKEISPLVNEFIFTKVDLKRSAMPATLAEIAAGLGKKSRVSPEVGTALREIMDQQAANDVLLVTGSLFVVGEARRVFQFDRVC